MPIIQQIIHLDTMFHQLKHAPVLINHMACSTIEDREKVKENLTTHLNSDQISLVPSCQCGQTKGEYTKSTICPTCNTEVKASVVSDIEPLVWLKQPEGVEKLPNPIIFMMLMKRFTKSGFSVIEWLCNTNYSTMAKTPTAILGKITANKIERGYNYFVQNFDFIMETLFSISDFAMKTPKFEGKSLKKIDYLEDIIKKERNIIFNEYIPLPNKTVLIFDTQALGTWTDPSIMKAVDAINTLVSIDRDFYDQSSKTKQNRTIKAFAMLCSFYDDTFALMAHKHGHFRKHLYGSRTNFSFRAVITSITAGREYDEIEAPWCMAITVFRDHLLNLLAEYGMSLNDSIGFLYKHTNRHHPLLESMMTKMVENTRGGKGIYVLIQRNPSLLQGSAQRVRIIKFKNNPMDLTIGMHILTVRA